MTHKHKHEEPRDYTEYEEAGIENNTRISSSYIVLGCIAIAAIIFLAYTLLVPVRIEPIPSAVEPVQIKTKPSAGLDNTHRYVISMPVQAP